MHQTTNSLATVLQQYKPSTYSTLRKQPKIKLSQTVITIHDEESK
jgi:hypothetical protein